MGKLCKISNPAEIESCASAQGSAGSSLCVGTRVERVSKKRSSFEVVKANGSRCSAKRKLFSPWRLEAKGTSREVLDAVKDGHLSPSRMCGPCVSESPSPRASGLSADADQSRLGEKSAEHSRSFASLQRGKTSSCLCRRPGTRPCLSRRFPGSSRHRFGGRWKRG